MAEGHFLLPGQQYWIIQLAIPELAASRQPVAEDLGDSKLFLQAVHLLHYFFISFFYPILLLLRMGFILIKLIILAK